jgi:hypothetical protein
MDGTGAQAGRRCQEARQHACRYGESELPVFSHDDSCMPAEEKFRGKLLVATWRNITSATTYNFYKKVGGTATAQEANGLGRGTSH